MSDTQEKTTLNYTIHKCSGNTARFTPENIMVNSPSNQLSRWYTDSILSPQFIIMKLDSPAIVQSITFGKYIKDHVSNLKKFQVFGGMEERNMSELLTAGLKNDSNAETFELRHRTKEGLYLPVIYVKIVPIQSWGPAYSYTIWFIELKGKNNCDLMEDVVDTFNLLKEEETVRILLKHLRRRRYKGAFEALSRESGVRLEGPVQARLWNAIVENGDFELGEKILDEAIEDGELDWYMSWQQYTPRWRQLSPCSAAVEARLSDSPPPAVVQPRRTELACADRDCADEPSINDSYESTEPISPSSFCNKPGPRGGHQLVVDSNTGTLYLFGGWNGTEDLDDLWSFDTTTERWSLLCRHSGLVGGPSPRSCHKMVFDPGYKNLYTLGRYLDNAERVPGNMKSDLYSYDTAWGGWRLLQQDTATVGGPRLVFDHQMCVDGDAHIIYVFGGRVLPANTDEVGCPQYSGLYAYYINTDTWQQLLCEETESIIRPRVGHSMLFHPSERRLYIFAGQRNKEHLQELSWYSVEDARVGTLGAAPAPRAPPAQGFTQRATLDPHQGEMFVLSGMSKEKDKQVYNTLWVFSLRRMTWSCVYRNGSVRPDEPRPRFAHQLVYDTVRKVHYLFGGNPGGQSTPRLRLDDLWALRLERAARSGVVRGLRAVLREARYRQLCVRDAPAAVRYLRDELRAALDLRDPAQEQHFQKLATLLFAGAPPRPVRAPPAPLTPARVRGLARRRAGAGVYCGDLARCVAAVLGADDSIVEPTQPYEETSPPDVDTWDVGDDEHDDERHDDDDERRARIDLYDHLCTYFRPSRVPPKADIGDLVQL